MALKCTLVQLTPWVNILFQEILLVAPDGAKNVVSKYIRIEWNFCLLKNKS